MGLVESREREVNIVEGYRVVDMEFESQTREGLLSPPDRLWGPKLSY